MAATGAIRKQLETSTQNGREQMEKVTEATQRVVGDCLKNAEEILKTCETWRNESDGSSAFDSITERAEEDIEAIMRLNRMIARLNEISSSGKQEGIAEVFQSVIAEVAEVSSKFEMTGKELNDMKGFDDKKKEFVEMLVERNRKVANCLNHTYTSLLKQFQELSLAGDVSWSSPITTSTPKSRKPSQPPSPQILFLLGKSFERFYFIERLMLVGKVTLGDDSKISSQPSPPRNLMEPGRREYVRGFLQDEAGNLDKVALRLMKPAGEPNDTEGTLMARVELHGQHFETTMPVFEIELSQRADESPKVVAIVENEQTGEPKAVELSLVQTSPGPQIHGRILGFQNSSQVADTTVGSLNRSQAQMADKQFDESVDMIDVIEKALSAQLMDEPTLLTTVDLIGKIENLLSETLTKENLIDEAADTIVNHLMRTEDEPRASQPSNYRKETARTLQNKSSLDAPYYFSNTMSRSEFNERLREHNRSVQPFMKSPRRPNKSSYDDKEKPRDSQPQQEKARTLPTLPSHNARNEFRFHTMSRSEFNERLRKQSQSLQPYQKPPKQRGETHRTVQIVPSRIPEDALGLQIRPSLERIYNNELGDDGSMSYDLGPVNEMLEEVLQTLNDSIAKSEKAQRMKAMEDYEVEESLDTAYRRFKRKMNESNKNTSTLEGVEATRTWEFDDEDLEDEDMPLVDLHA